MDRFFSHSGVSRRHFLTRIGTASAAICATQAQTITQAWAQASPAGGASALEFGVRPDAGIDQSQAFQKMVDRAAQRGVALFLPAGLYVIGQIVLPSGLVMAGVRGQTQLVHNGAGYMLAAANAKSIQLRDLIIHGGRRWTAQRAHGLLDCRQVSDLQIDGCTLAHAPEDALYLEQCSGTVRDSTLRDAARFGLFSMQGRGMTIKDNQVERCGNGGIIVHRWEAGDDNSVITGNRVSAIRAANGGTGQWGNGINLFRTHSAIVTNNMIRDCAFSAIRANATQALTIAQNQCRNSGETAIYAEFGFQDALVNGNLIDGATNGISITNFNDGGRSATVIGNIVRNLRLQGSYEPMAPGFGIGIAVEADTTVTGNVIENAEQYGINVGWGPNLRDCVVASNVIRQSRIGIGVSAAQGAGTALLSGNVINAQRGAIVAHAWNKPVSQDLTATNTAPPTNIILRNNRVT